MEHITLFTDILPEEQERIACLLQSPGESFSEWRNHNGIFQLHEKDRSDPGG